MNLVLVFSILGVISVVATWLNFFWNNRVAVWTNLISFTAFTGYFIWYINYMVSAMDNNFSFLSQMIMRIITGTI